MPSSASSIARGIGGKFDDINRQELCHTLTSWRFALPALARFDFGIGQNRAEGCPPKLRASG